MMIFSCPKKSPKCSSGIFCHWHFNFNKWSP